MRARRASHLASCRIALAVGAQASQARCASYLRSPALE